MAEREEPLEDHHLVALSPPQVVPMEQRAEWLSFFSGPVWVDVQEFLAEVREASHEGVVNAQSWEGFKEERGRFLVAEQVFSFFADRYDEVVGKPLLQ